MNENIKLILSLSISGSILAGIIFFIKPIIRDRLSKSIQYYIWLVVLLRLVLPFSFETSLMNKIFYSSDIQGTGTAVHEGVKTTSPSADDMNITLKSDKTAKGEETVQYTSSAKNLDIIAIFKNNLFLIWMLGAIAVFAANLMGYARFMKYMKAENKPSHEREKVLLMELLNGRQKAVLVRNKFAATPMLTGIIKPCIIIPDIEFTQNQIRNILLHEAMHMKRFDLGIKWLTVIAASLHWFNPLMYFIKKEVSHSCELSCDEGVIRNLSDEDKQGYGDTLISVVAERKYPVGILSTTMCEEKRTLKERLISIMNHSKKSRLITIISVILVVSITCTSIVLGAGVGIGTRMPPDIYIRTDSQKTKHAIMGGYSWRIGNEFINADAIHPTGFDYKSENTISVTSKEQFIISTQKINSDKQYNFTLEQVELYKSGFSGGQKNKLESSETRFLNNNLYLQAPEASGEYIYSLQLNFKDKGTVNYGFVVRVDMITYDLSEIEKSKTPYIGNHSKVLGIVGQLPVPVRGFKQQYISMRTSEKPYKLTVYYEGISETGLNKYEEPISASDSTTYSNLQRNALVLFCMIGNLDEVTFAFRNTPSSGDLEDSEYKSKFAFSKEDMWTFGNIQQLSKDTELLDKALRGETTISFTEIESLLATIMSSPLSSSNTDDYIAAHRAEYNTIVGMSEEALPYLIGVLESEDLGLEGNIAQRICIDISKEASKRKDIDDEGRRLLNMADYAVENWNRVMQHKPVEPLPEFTEEELALARAVVEEYYRAILAKDDKAILATLHESRRIGNVVLYGTEKRTLLTVDYNSQDSKRRSYRTGDGRFAPGKVIVFKVSFNIEYPKGEGGPWNSGVYKDWNMILVREDEKSPWLIYDQGY